MIKLIETSAGTIFTQHKETNMLKQHLIMYFSDPENYSSGYYHYIKNQPIADWCNAVMEHAVDMGMPENEVAEAEQEGIAKLKQTNPELFK